MFLGFSRVVFSDAVSILVAAINILLLFIDILSVICLTAIGLFGKPLGHRLINIVTVYMWPIVVVFLCSYDKPLVAVDTFESDDLREISFSKKMEMVFGEFLL